MCIRHVYMCMCSFRSSINHRSIYIHIHVYTYTHTQHIYKHMCIYTSHTLVCVHIRRDGLNRYPMEFTLARKRYGELVSLGVFPKEERLPGAGLPSEVSFVGYTVYMWSFGCLQWFVSWHVYHVFMCMYVLHECLCIGVCVCVTHYRLISGHAM